jgi:hypothetical protein
VILNAPFLALRAVHIFNSLAEVFNMEILGIDWGYLFVMLFNILLVGGWLILAAFALFRLRHLELTEMARAIWAALILLVPIGGALAFWIVQPGVRSPEASEKGREG